jgi:hypothetical protein
MTETITADSAPDFDAWGPDAAWDCPEWVAWWHAMAARDGPEAADRRWIAAWRSGLPTAAGGTGEAPGASWGGNAVPVGCRDFHRPFRELVLARPALYAVVYHGLGGVIGEASGAAAEVAHLAHQLANVGAQSPGISAGVIALGIGLYWLINRRR